MPKKLIVFTDGSCPDNGKPGAIGGIGVHFPNGELKDVSKIFPYDFCTSQRTELYAILIALKYIKKNLGLKDRKIEIYTDSEYSKNCITKWIEGWIENGWRTKKDTPVQNKELIEPIYDYYQKYDITFKHVSAHMKDNDPNTVANNRADYLATKASKKAKGSKKTKDDTIIVELMGSD